MNPWFGEERRILAIFVGESGPWHRITPLAFSYNPAMSDSLPLLPRPIVILGPTAGGKSELAVQLAVRLGEKTGKPGQILGADSMQVYRHMEAGTAKPDASQRARAVHHLIDIVEPTERFTVADWIARADTIIESLQHQGITPIVVGGTNLYLKALLEGMFDGPGIDEALRDELNAISIVDLRQRFEAIDPVAAIRIHANDRKRMVRAIEVFQQTGKRISELQTQWEGNESSEFRVSSSELKDSGSAPALSDSSTRNSELETRNLGPSYRHNPILIGLHWPVELINPRINARVKTMFFPGTEGVDGATPQAAESLPAETARLESLNLLGPQARKALGYQQVLDHLHNPEKISLDDALEQTKILTRRFAKTQRTWLKRFRGVHWFEAATVPVEQMTEQIMTLM